MRFYYVAPLLFATALCSSAYAASNSAPSNSAHVCGNTNLSANDQMDCRTQMDAAHTEGERLQVQNNFEKLSASATGEASTTGVKRGSAKASVADQPTPNTKSSAAPSDSYPAAEPKAPVYPGEVPDPKTGKPPT